MMKFYRSFIVIIIISLLTFSFKEKNLVGIYVSREPSSMETLTLMYSRGYFEFLTYYDDYIKLRIEKDSSFHYIANKKERFGKWKVKGNTLILDFADVSRDDLELRIRNNKLYNISEVTLCKSKKKMMSLMMLEKKETH